MLSAARLPSFNHRLWSQTSPKVLPEMRPARMTTTVGGSTLSEEVLRYDVLLVPTFVRGRHGYLKERSMVGISFTGKLSWSVSDAKAMVT